MHELCFRPQKKLRARKKSGEEFLVDTLRDALRKCESKSSYQIIFVVMQDDFCEKRCGFLLELPSRKWFLQVLTIL